MYIHSPGVSLKSHIWPPTLSTGIDTPSPTSLQPSPDLSLQICSTHSLLYLRNSSSLPQLLRPKTSESFLTFFPSHSSHPTCWGILMALTLKRFIIWLLLSSSAVTTVARGTCHSLLNRSKAPDFPLWAAALIVAYTVLPRWVLQPLYDHMAAPISLPHSTPAPGPPCCSPNITTYSLFLGLCTQLLLCLQYSPITHLPG